MVPDNLEFRAFRIDNDGRLMAENGKVVTQLWVICPWCQTPFVLAEWHDGGGVQIGSLSCNAEGCDCPDVLNVYVEQLPKPVESEE